MRQRLCQALDFADAVDASAVNALVSSIQPDGSWPDVQYDDSALRDWAAARHLHRLQLLAHAWFTPGSALSQNAAVLQAILRGLDFWYVRNPQNPNWWWHQIGAPLLLAKTLLCVKPACERSYIERAVPAFECHQPAFRFTGQNLVWVADVQIRHGILADEPSRVAQGLNYARSTLRITPGEEGIQPDMSFHQHGKLLYSGGYGQGFAADIGRLIALASGTSYAWPEHLVARYAEFLLDGSRWLVRGRTFNPGAVGREITRVGHAARGFLIGLRHLADLEHARQAEARASVAVGSKSGRSMVNGNRHFWRSDLMVQHRPAYYLSVRLASRRLLNADMAACGGEGRRCHHMADGAVFVMCDGDEYRDIYPVWNWRQIPGTTTVQQPGELDPERLRHFGERAFAGGASDGTAGCAAMGFSLAGLTARKAWFFFDEGLVALGTGIACNEEHPVRTTLNQCNWRGPAFLFGAQAALEAGEYPLNAGAAFWHDRVTWRVLDGAGRLRLGPQAGAWSDCGVGSPEKQTLNVLNAGLEHGCRPDSARYAYAILPGVEQNAVFADDPRRFVVVRNDAALQAVWHAGEKRGQAVFYEPGTAEFPDGQRLSVDTPCILLYQPRADASALTVAQPEQRDGIVTLRLEGRIRTTLGLPLPERERAGSSLTVMLGV